MTTPQPVSFAHFGWFVLVPFVAAALTYFFARKTFLRAAIAIGRCSAALGLFDIEVIDRLVLGGAARLLRAIAQFATKCDAWVVGGVVQIIAGTIWAISIPMRMLQSGSLRSYMFAMVMGLIGFLGYYLYLARHSIR